jgi:hypothetical protein
VRRATGTAVAGVIAVLCAVVLAGCQGHSVATQQVNSVVTPASGSTATTAPAAGATGSTSAANANGANGAGPAGAGVDSDLSTVDGQLAGLDSAMAQATQSPSDGG